MKTQSLEIGGATAILYGETREKGYLFLHGQMGCKGRPLPVWPAQRDIRCWLSICLTTDSAGIREKS